MLTLLAGDQDDEESVLRRSFRKRLDAAGL